MRMARIFIIRNSLNYMSDFKTETMRRIYFIWAIRYILNPVTIKIAAIAIITWQLFTRVSIITIFQNWRTMGADLAATFRFLESAFLNTEAMVQLLTLGVGILAALLVYDIAIRHKKHQIAARV